MAYFKQGEHEADALVTARDTEEIHYDGNTQAIVGGKVVVDWFNASAADCPEDLVWHRAIGELFFDAFRAGYDARKSQEESESE